MRELETGKLAKQDRSRRLQSPHDRGVFRWHVVVVQGRLHRGPGRGGFDIVPQRARNAVDRPAVVAGCYFPLGGARLVKRALLSDQQIASYEGIEPTDALKVSLG